MLYNEFNNFKFNICYRWWVLQNNSFRMWDKHAVPTNFSYYYLSLRLYARMNFIQQNVTSVEEK